MEQEPTSEANSFPANQKYSLYFMKPRGSLPCSHNIRPLSWASAIRSTSSLNIKAYFNNISRSQWPRGLRRRSAAASLLRSWVRILSEAWMFVCCECCVSGRGLCDELITRPEEFYRLWCVVVCDLETSRMRRPWPELGRSATARKKN